MKRYVLLVLFVLSRFASAAGTQALSIDPDTGLLVFPDPAESVQFANWSPSQFKINSQQLVATGKTVSFANSTAFAGVDGKTLTVNQNLTLTGTSGKVLTLTGSFTAGADTSITGGGTIALGGFTLTVPAAGTAALGAGTLTVSSTSDVTGANHTHPITASSNPGAATALLKSDSAGGLQLPKIMLGSSSAGFTGTGSVVNPLSGDSIRSTTFTSGLVGWSINESGSAEFDNVDVRGAVHASVIVYGQVQATAGTILTSKSAAKLKTDVAIPSVLTYGTTAVNIDVVDADGLSHASSQLFVVNDILYMKDGLIGATWFKVSSVSDQTTFWRYTCTIQAGTNNVTYRAGLGVADYGGSGSGFIVQTADATNAPYLQMATHAGTFTSANSSGTLIVTPQLRIGQLNGSYDYSSSTFGFAVGDYSTGFWLSADPSNGVRINSPNGGLKLDGAGLRLNSALSLTGLNSLSFYPGVGNDAETTAWLANSYIGGSSVTRLTTAPRSGDTATGTSLISIETRKPGNGTGLTSTSRFELHSDVATAKSWAFITLGNVDSPTYTFDGFAVGSAAHPTHMFETYGTGWFQSDVTVGNGGTGNARAALIINGGSGTGGVSSAVVRLQNNGAADAAAFGTEIAIVGSGSNTKTTLYSSSSTYRLYGMGAGTLSTDASGNITASSDATLKNIDGEFTRGSIDLLGIHPKLFHWKKETDLDTTEQYAGPIAQDVLPYVPEAVGLDSNGKHTLSDHVLVATLINSSNEHTVTLRKMQAQIDALAQGNESAQKAQPPAFRDPVDRRAIASTRLAGLKIRQSARHAAEEAARPKPLAKPSSSPTPTPTPTPPPKRKK